MDNLKSILNSIHVLLEKGQYDDALNQLSLVESFSLEASEEDIGVVISDLFGDNNSLYTFLKSGQKFKAADDFHCVVCDIIEKICHKVGKRLEPKCNKLKDTLISTYKLSSTAKPKKATLNALVKVLKVASESNDLDGYNIESMVNFLFTEINDYKVVPTVAEILFRVLGCTSKYFSQYFTESADRLESIAIKKLTNEMRSKKEPGFLIISGSFEALTNLYFHFPPHQRNKSEILKEVFGFIKDVLSTKGQVNRYDIIRKCCSFISHHSKLISHLFLTGTNDRIPSIYTSLYYWSSSSNDEVRSYAIKAIHAVLAKISESIATTFRDAKESSSNPQTLNFSTFPEAVMLNKFLGTFTNITTKTNSSISETMLAIQGIGFFSKPASYVLSQSDMNSLFDKIAQLTDTLFPHLSSQQTSQYFQHHNLKKLPSFVEALARLAIQCVGVNGQPSVCISRLATFSVSLFKALPHMQESLAYDSRRALVLTFLAFGGEEVPNGESILLKEFLEYFVHRSIVQTCSHPPPVLQEEEDEEESDDDKRERLASGWTERKVTYSVYIPVWSFLLDLNLEGMTGIEMKASLQSSIRDNIYDQIMTSVVRIIDRLDLSYRRNKDSTSTSSASTPSDDLDVDLTADLVANTPKNFAILINLVEFMKDILPLHNIKRFKNWAEYLITTIINKTLEFPLISAFYQLLSLALNMANKIDFFDSRVNQALCSPELSNQITSFARETLCAIKQYKEDLLAACLSFLLSLPASIVIGERTQDSLIDQLTPALSSAILLGCTSYLPLAAASITALEAWTSHLPAHLHEACLAQLLPCFDTLLSSAESSSNSPQASLTGNTFGASAATGRRDKRALARSLRAINLMRHRERLAGGWRSSLVLSQLALLRYLGRLGGRYNHLILSQKRINDVTTNGVYASVVDLSSCVRWDPIDRIEFDLCFSDLKTAFYLDVFLSRIINIASGSADRAAKLAASELLHAVVLVMIGLEAGMRRRNTQGGQMKDLWKHVLPCVIQLACDLDTVTRDLFRSLLLQMIHWYTSPTSISDTGDILLDSLMQALALSSTTSQTHDKFTVDVNSAGQRELAGDCLREFLIWALKHDIPDTTGSPKASGDSRKHAEKLLDRISALARHPSALRRLGATRAFNSIYVVFREKELLVDMYAFQILSDFIESIILAEKDERSLGTQEQCITALLHIQRIIAHKPYVAILSVSSARRLKPTRWTDATLEFCLRWLLTQCGSIHTQCRRISIMLVQSLAGCIKGANNRPHLLFESLLKQKGRGYFVRKFEQVNLLAISSPVSAQIDWMKGLMASLECYTWVMDHGLLTPAQMFTGSAASASPTKRTKTSANQDQEEDRPPRLVQALCQFVETVSMTTVNKEINPKELAEFNELRATVTLRLMNLMAVCLSKLSATNISLVLPGPFWSPNLWHLLATAQLTPALLGFNMTDKEVIKNLPLEWIRLTQTFKKMSSDRKTAYVSALKDTIQGISSDNLLDLLPVEFTSARPDSGSDTISARDKLYLVTSLKDIYLHNPDLKELLNVLLLNSDHAVALFQKITQYFSLKRDTLSILPTNRHFCIKILQLIFAIGMQPDVFLVSLFEPGGQTFYLEFSSAVDIELIDNAVILWPVILSQCLSSDAQFVCKLLHHSLLCILKEKELAVKYAKPLVSSLSSNWEFILNMVRTSTSKQLFTAIPPILTNMILLDKTVCTVPAIFDNYIFLLNNPVLDLVEKIPLLDLLAFFAHTPHSTDTLQSALNHLTSCFPAKSTEFPLDSKNQAEYFAAVRSLICALELSGSTMVLELIVKIFCREDQHLLESEMQTSLGRMIARIPADKQVELIKLPFIKFRQPPSLWVRCLEKICLPLLNYANEHAVESFFLDCIEELVQQVELPTDNANIVNQTGVFLLLSSMYNRLSKPKLNSPQSRIVRQYLKNSSDFEGNELTKKLIKLFHDRVAVALSPLAGSPEECRRLVNAAYSALAALVTATQTKECFFITFLIHEAPKKNHYLLEHLLPSDAESPFLFSELDRPLEKKQTFITIRRDLRSLDEGSVSSQTSDSSQIESSNSNSDGRRSNRSYISSQYLSDSSLSMDLNHFDRLGGDQILLHESQQMTKSGPNVVEESETSPFTMLHSLGEWEMDCVNKMPCMSVLVTLLKHMHQHKIISQFPKGTAINDKPPWMSYFHQKFTSTASLNIKIFIAKLIINCEEIFRPYAPVWLIPLTSLLISHDTTSSEGTQNHSPSFFNTFTVDLIYVLLLWVPLARPRSDSPQDRHMASGLVTKMATHCYHSNTSLTRSNLEIFKTLVENWKEAITFPFKIVYDNMLRSSVDAKSTRSATGLQMLSIFLVNQILPFTNSDEKEEKKMFLRALSDNLSHSHKVVYAPAYEVTGQLFSLLNASSSQSNEKDSLSLFLEAVKRHLMESLSRRLDTFCLGVQLIGKSYPAFIGPPWVSHIYQNLERMDPDMLCRCLEVLTLAVPKEANLYMQLKLLKFFQFLYTQSPKVLQVAFLFLSVLIKATNQEPLDNPASRVQYLIECVLPCRTSRHASVRMALYNLLKDVYNKTGCPLQDASIHDVLLSGLADSDYQIQLNLHNFWTSDQHLSKVTQNRALTLLSPKMFTVQAETSYLDYVTSLLMEMTSFSPDFVKPVFSHPLSKEAVFNPVKLKVGSRTRCTMRPLFLQSQSGTANVGSQSQSLIGPLTQTLSQTQGSSKPIVAATQGSSILAFTPTQQLTSRPVNAEQTGNFDWLSQDVSITSQSLSIGPEVAVSSDRTLYGPSTSFLLAVKNNTRKRNANVLDTDDTEKHVSAIKRLRRRFLSDTVPSPGESQYTSSTTPQTSASAAEKTKQFFVKRYTDQRKADDRAASSWRSEMEKGKHLCLYRSYRCGDLPDIEVPNRAVIAPLQALVRLDSGIAELLFTQLYSCILTELSSKLPDVQLSEVKTSFRSGLEHILGSSATYPPGLIGACLQLALKWSCLQRDAPILIPAQTVATAAIQSGQQILGILLLENYLLRGDVDTDDSQDSVDNSQHSKRRKLERDPRLLLQPEYKESKTGWELIRLYRSYGTMDEVVGLLQQWSGGSNTGGVALPLKAEASADFELACEQYLEQLNEGYLSEEVQSLCNEGLMTSLNHLSRWDDLDEKAMKTLKRDKLVTTSTETEEYDLFDLDSPGLNWVLRARVKSISRYMHVDRDEVPQLLREKMEDLESWLSCGLSNPDIQPLLESRFGMEIALVYIWQNDHFKAKYLCDKTLQSIAQDWSAINPLMTEAKQAKLQSVQTLTEMAEFLAVFQDDNDVEIESLINRWLNRPPHTSLDSTSTWNDVITNRCTYIELLWDKLQAREVDLPMAKQSRARFQLDEASAALTNGNVALAFSLLKSAQRVCAASILPEAHGLSELWFAWTHLMADSWCMNASRLLIDSEGGGNKVDRYVNGLLSARKALEKHTVPSGLRCLQLEHTWRMGDTLTSLSQLADRYWPQVEANNQRVDQLRTLCTSECETQHQLCGGLLNSAYSSYKTGLSKTIDQTNPDVSDIRAMAAAHIRLSDFCDTLLEKIDDKENKLENLPSNKELSSALVKSVLHGMKLDELGARLRFARALQIAESHPETHSDFINMSAQLPSWMFLLWTEQLFACLGNSDSSLVKQLLPEIAKDYPWALVYPFRIFKDGFDASKATPEVISVNKKIEECLKPIPYVDRLIFELDHLNHPLSIFKSWKTQYASVLGKSTSSLEERAKGELEFRQIYHNLVACAPPPSTSSNCSLYDTQSSIGHDANTTTPGVTTKGSYRLKMANVILKKVSAILGADGSRISQLNANEWENVIKLVNDALASKELHNPPTELAAYSLWLANYNSVHFSTDQLLELPGQYSASWGKPMPERHHKIASFKPKILVLTSLQCPKQLTVVCSDAVERSFLVKSGEDLRQDARIQQCCQLANHIITRHKRAGGALQPLRTYAVLPMTRRLGLLEWLNDTRVLGDALKSQWTKEMMAKYNSQVERHLTKVLKVENPTATWETVSNLDIFKSVASVRNVLEPCNSLRQAYLSMSVSSEAFYLLRSRFIHSHASMSALHYILGIGDRHLSNSLICQRTGEIIGIDFGYAFGVATLLLPIPELLPFRLTWAIQEMMCPSGVYGTFKQDLTRTLAALRHHKQLIMATLQVFIKEQSVDWVRYGRRVTHSRDDTYPRQRLESARRKLCGDSPAILLESDVSIIKSKESWFPALSKYLLQFNTRSALSPEDQANLLIQLATDPHILGRSFKGWEPFV